MSKLGIVTKHEYLTIVKQPSFWITMIAIPLFIGAIMAISYFGSKSSEDKVEELARDLKNVAIVDHSGLIRPEIVQSAGLALSDPSLQEGLREDVREQRKEALIVYPSDIQSSRKYQVYLSTDDFTKNGSVTSLGDTILETSVFAPLGSSDLVMLAKDGASTEVTTYRDGRETAGINEYIVPGLIVVLFYIIFFFSVGYMLTSIGEEKENRSMEMVLTYVRDRTLIVGKLLAVSLITLTQIAFFAVLLGIGLAVFSALGNDLTLIAGIDLSKLVFNPLTIFFGFGYLIAGFMMFAGFMTATAAAAPSTREANGFSAVFYIGAFAPFWILMLVLTDPENPMTKFATFFPLTSPATTLLRNTVGNMSVLESTLALLVMSAFAVLSIGIAVRMFRLGALEFSGVVSLKQLLRRG